MLNTYAPNIDTFNFIKKKLLDIKRQIDIDTVIVAYPPLTNKRINQIKKKKSTSNISVGPHYQINGFNSYTNDLVNNKVHIFSAAHRTFFKTDHILGHKTCLNI